MADYEVILDAELEPGAPITSSIGFRFRDNPVAIAEGAAGAPRVSSGALEDASVTSAKIASGSVSQAKMQSNSVGTSQIKFGSNSVSGGVGGGGNQTISLNDFALFPSISNGGDFVLKTAGGSASASSPKFAIENTAGVNRTYEVAWRFLSS